MIIGDNNEKAILAATQSNNKLILKREFCFVNGFENKANWPEFLSEVVFLTKMYSLTMARLTVA